MPLKQGDVARVHYEGKLEDGSVFDSSYDREPLEFVVGEGVLLPKFEEAVLGKKKGEKIDIIIPALDAYGERDETLVLRVERSIFDIETIEEGSLLEVETDEGPITVVVLEVDGEHVTIDGNHPLAGMDLYFSIEIQ